MKNNENNKALIVKRVTNLFTVKSIISLSLLFVFCYLTYNQYEVPQVLESTFGYVIAFFLGSQASKSEAVNSIKQEETLNEKE